ncbi:ribose-phosphate diphosphokinase [Nocardia sp. NPDC052278]|uniref:ribose-phosphate diphosphokinase n=1 Tax=unclassified Nocardia TaxID=2637762 RepID=UPI0036CA6650
MQRPRCIHPWLIGARECNTPGTRSGQALGLRVVVEAIARAGADRLVVVDPHTEALEAISPMPVEISTAVPLLAEAAVPARSGRTIVVAPDFGAAKLAEQYAASMQDSVAIVRKFRESATEVSAVEMIGDISGCPVLIVDDMISTDATIEAAIQILHYHATDIVAAATHGPLVPPAAARLRALALRRVIVTDTVAQQDSAAPFEVRSVAPLLADAIARMHHNQPLRELLAHT